MSQQSPRRQSHKGCPAQDGGLRTECDNPASEDGMFYTADDWDDVTCDDCLRVLAGRRAKMEPAYWENLG